MILLGRGQHDEPAGGLQTTGQAGLLGRYRQPWRRSGERHPSRHLRRGPDGLPDARDGRVRGHRRDPPYRRNRSANTDHRDDRGRHGRAIGTPAWPPAWTTTSPSRFARTPLPPCSSDGLPGLRMTHRRAGDDPVFRRRRAPIPSTEPRSRFCSVSTMARAPCSGEIVEEYLTQTVDVRAELSRERSTQVTIMPWNAPRTSSGACAQTLVRPR